MCFPLVTSDSNEPSQTSTEGAIVSRVSVRSGGLSGQWPVGTSGGLSETSNWAEVIMPKHFYLSTRKDRSSQAKVVLESLKAHGWEPTFVWSDVDDNGPDGYADVALAELEGVREADVLIVLLPGGYGTHVEIGAALALGKPVIIHAPDHKTLETPYPCIFHYHPGVKLLVSEVLDSEAILACMPLCAGNAFT